MAMTKRRRISTTKRLAVFTTHKGLCDICGGAITVGQAWEISHRIPLELGGADDESNWFPAHKVCHASQTRTNDIPAIARAKRREAVRLGAKVSAGTLKSAGFAKAEPQRRASKPLAKDMPPRRSMYEDAAE